MTSRPLLWYSSQARAKAIASCRYRIGNLAEVIRNVSVVLDPQLPSGALANTAALVVIRPFPSRALRQTLEECRRRNIVRIADYDDLLFAGDAAERPEVEGGRLSLSWMQRAHAGYASMLPMFDAFTVATKPLADELGRARPGAIVTVVPNALSPSWVAQGRALYPSWSPGDPRVIRFFPGSPTHDASFREIAPAIARFLDEHSDARLELVGNLDWDPRTFPDGRARHVGARSFDELPELLASAWVNLWPRADTRFNRGKSPIKFLEAAAFGTPTVASAPCVTADIACAGLRAAHTPTDWRDELEWLSNPYNHASAREACLAMASTHGAATVLPEAFASAIGAARGC